MYSLQAHHLHLRNRTNSRLFEKTYSFHLLGTQTRSSFVDVTTSFSLLLAQALFMLAAQLATVIVPLNDRCERKGVNWKWLFFGDVDVCATCVFAIHTIKSLAQPRNTEQMLAF